MEDLIEQYLAQAKLMQIATLSGDQPWICTVYTVADENLNLYWLSLPTRRHSREIEQHDKVSVALAIKYDKPVIGIQAEGKAEVVSNDATISKIMKLYVEKYNSGKDFYDNFIAGKNQHQMYRFSPSSFVLFDEVNFPENGRQVWQSNN